ASGLAKGPLNLAFNLQGEGLSPPGLVAGLSGEGTLSLGPGALMALNPDPLRRVAVVASNKRIKVDKDQIAEEARTVREKVTKGIYKYGPSKLAFDVKSGTLHLSPTTLASPTGVAKINGYVELASLKLDSEWAVSLAGARNQDVPPVTLVFAGALNQADAIAPSIDTGAIESYLTMRRMQEDVERLETLDVSGKTLPPFDSGATAENPPLESPAEATQPSEPSPRAETEEPREALPQSAPASSANVASPPTEAREEPPSQPDENDGIARVLADPANQPAAERPAETSGDAAASAATAEPEPLAPPPPPTETAAPEPSAPPPPMETAEPEPSAPPTATTETAEPETSPPSAPTIAAPEEPPLPTPAPDAVTNSEAQPTAAAADVAAPPRQRTSSRPRRPLSAREAPDAWKKGISIFGP